MCGSQHWYVAKRGAGMRVIEQSMRQMVAAD
jgi:hypothetical protein